ncbi:hypothetical protein HYV10_00045 [Candidatus Dependentiae bacterium]|nr:hypothetical protein [Candidatus Dependentiae bacterium]
MNIQNKKSTIAKNILFCEGVKYYCKEDEDVFFEWIEKIKCIETFSYRWKFLYLHIPSGNIDDESLKELLSLFYRYNIKMSQLAEFLTKNNKKWFYDNKKSFWYKNVFQNKKI